MSSKRLVADVARSICLIYVTCLIFPSTRLLSEPDQSLGDKAWTILKAGLDDQKADKRAAAVLALGVMPGDGRALAAAEHALQDTSPPVRRAAVTALGDMNARESLPKIKALVDQSDAETVVTIAGVLNRFKDPEAYDLYYEILTGKRKGGGSLTDGLKDRKALQKLGVESAVGFLPFGGFATGAYNYVAKSGSARANLDVTAINVLTEDPDPAVDQALMNAAFSDKEMVQVAALRALAKRGNPACVNDIEVAMYSGKPLVSYTTAAAVLHLLGRPVKAAAGRR